MAKKKTTKSRPRKSKSTAKNSRIVSRQKDVAAALGVTPNAVAQWRTKGMPGKPGQYDLDAIEAWRQKTIRPTSKTDDEQESAADVRARLLAAQADKERANANMAQRQDNLEQGGYCAIEDVNTFMGDFFSELRALLNRMNVEMPAGFSPKLKKQLREELTERHNLVLRQMHDWAIRTEDLEIEQKAKK